MATLSALVTRIAQDINSVRRRVGDLERDTGLRSIPLRDGVSGEIFVQRQGDRVSVQLRSVVLPAGTFSFVVADLPSGFRSSSDTPFLAADVTWVSPASMYVARAQHNLYWVRALPDTSTHPTTPQSGEVIFRTINSWPTTLPGTPA